MRPGHEGGLGAQGEGHRVVRVVQRAERCRLGDLARLRSRRILALGEPVNLVIEENDREIHVAPEGVEQVVAADGQGVAVAGDYPYMQVWPAHRDTGRDRRGPPVNGMDAVSVHIIGKTGTAPNARYEHGVFPAGSQLWHEHLHGHQDGEVPTAGAPPDLLIAGPILLGGRGNGNVSHYGVTLFPVVLSVEE